MRISPSHAAGISWIHAAKDAVVAGLITLILLGPITNLVLQQYSFQLVPDRIPVVVNGLIMALIVCAVRFCVSVWAQSTHGRQSLQYFQRKKTAQASVIEPDSNAFLRHMRKALSICAILAFLCLALAWLDFIPAGAASALILSGLFVVFAFGISLPKPDEQKPGWAVVVPLLFLCGFLLPVVLNQAGLLPKVWSSNLTLALIYVLLGLGLNIVVGMAGLLDLGFVGFYAVGAYLLALGHQYLDLGFWSVLLLTPVVAGLCGALLGFPVLRMHGDYLAIVTLGFGDSSAWCSPTGPRSPAARTARQPRPRPSWE